MALYRNIHLSFWQDTKVTDDFTPEDRYFYLYLLTNPHTNLCGCYEISIKQMANEMGYDVKKVIKLIERFSSIHNLIRYSQSGRELLIFHWSKYNWTSSEKFRKPLLQEIQNVKTDDFRVGNPDKVFDQGRHRYDFRVSGRGDNACLRRSYESYGLH